MRLVLIIISLHLSFALAAKETPPDSLAVSKLYSTSWILTAKYRPKGIFHRLKKVADLSSQRLTIYQDEIHISVNNGPYQICSSRHRNQNEFWLDCQQADQLIYRVISIDGDKLVMDILTRPKGKTAYVRTGRNHYTRLKNQSKYFLLSPMKESTSFLPSPVSADVKK